MNLSICIITKNEEQNIDRCLKALAPYGLETIVVDTGSTDRTKQIAARYTDRLYDFPWCDDFIRRQRMRSKRPRIPMYWFWTATGL